VALARQTGDRYLVGSILPKCANVAIDLGDLDRAETFGGEALGLFRALNDGWWTARCLNILMVIAFERGDQHRAARLLGGGEHLLHLAGARFNPSDARQKKRATESLRAELGAARFEASFAEGRSASVEQIVSYALDPVAQQLPR
jgi:hypothetical protein